MDPAELRAIKQRRRVILTGNDISGMSALRKPPQDAESCPKRAWNVIVERRIFSKHCDFGIPWACEWT